IYAFLFCNFKHFYFAINNALIWLALNAIAHFGSSINFDIIQHHFPFFPLCYITAAAGSIAACYLSQVICQLDRCCWFSRLGRHAIILLSIHALDTLWKWGWQITGSVWGDCALRIIWVILIYTIIILTAKCWKVWRTKKTCDKQKI
ncbi:MAG: hypothetical protein Q4F00_09070, partial [bacterium]|nr:hypothetical protein [bacterium]